MPLKEASEEMLIGEFRNGLRDNIRAELKLLWVGSLKELMGLAQQVEERDQIKGKVQEELMGKFSST